MKDLEIIKKAFYWCFNYSTPSTWIEYVAGGKNNMYNHFMDKWNYYCNMYEDGAVSFLALFCSMSNDYQEKLCEFIMKNYISNQNTDR